MKLALGEYEGIKIIYDSEMGEMNMLFGSAKKRKLPSGEEYVPLDVYKESVEREPFITDNEDFRKPEEKDLKREVKITWIIGGSNDVNAYKGAIDYIKTQFTLK